MTNLEQVVGELDLNPITSEKPIPRYVATTFPIGARDYTPKLGLMTTSLVTDILSRRYSNVDSVVAINLLDSYANRQDKLEPLLDAHNRLSINVRNAWIDNDPDNMRKLTSTIDKLSDLGVLRCDSRDVLICSDGCQRVEMLADSLIFPVGRMYHMDGGNIICNHCNQMAIVRKTNVLVVDFPSGIQVPEIYPSNMKKDSEELMERITKNSLLVSRTRDTGIIYAKEGRKYNLDVDFFWMNYLDSISNVDDSVILTGSNHIRRHLMTISALFESVRGVDSVDKLKILMPSYILKSDESTQVVNGGYMNESPNTMRLLIMASLAWKKDSKWAMGVYNNLKKHPEYTKIIKTFELGHADNINEVFDYYDRMKGSVVLKNLQYDNQKMNLVRGVVVNDIEETKEIEKISTKEILRRLGCIKNDHVEMRNGMHASEYLNKAGLIDHPKILNELAKRLVAQFKDDDYDFIVGPVNFGYALASYCALITDKPFTYILLANGDDGAYDASKSRMHRDFHASGKRALIIDDWVVSGSTVESCSDFLISQGFEVIGASVISSVGSRNNLTTSCDIRALCSLSEDRYEKSGCPICNNGAKIEKYDVRE